jgi:pimeloyl-ACP methyl ester carboxylesterase
MNPFVLIHGAFRGGWSFARLRPLLEAKGHPTYAPSLPGAGEHAASLDGTMTLARYAQCVASFLELEDLERVILVGHSQGGLVALAASELAHRRIARLVLLDSPVPRHCERAIDLVPRALAGMKVPPLARDMVLPPRPVTASETISASDAAWINARTCPSPVGPSLDPLVLANPRALALPASYVFFAKTPDTYPCAHGRQRLDDERIAYRTLDAPHDAPITHAPLVAGVLLEIARETLATATRSD